MNNGFLIYNCKISNFKNSKKFNQNMTDRRYFVGMLYYRTKIIPFYHKTLKLTEQSAEHNLY